ncbi:hypothetical protein BC941DRAFT_422271 [Chlamydoabsidia padenii]|nr:hypothetical protein BC941DRAFT_422271 [Chlamydoabsidia padenii]
MSTHGGRGGPAFEIRFCKGNKVQVFDLSRRWDVSGNQPLPNEYLEDDVINGRLRYSKLGNQWVSYNSMDTTKHQRPPQLTTPSVTDIVPALAKQRATEDAKEQEHIRQAQEAMQKALDRKKKIEMARRARKTRENVMERVASDPNLESLAGNRDDDVMDNNKDEEENFTNKIEQEQKPPSRMEMKKKSTRTKKKSSFSHETGPPPTTPLPKRQPSNYNSISISTSNPKNDHKRDDKHSLQQHDTPRTSLDTKSSTINVSYNHTLDHIQQQQIQGLSVYQNNSAIKQKSSSSVWCCIIS